MKQLRQQGKSGPASRQPIWVAVAAAILLAGTIAFAGAQTAIGGHIGFVLPIVTRVAGQTTNLGDNFVIGFPVGITIKGRGRMAFDMELVSSIQNKPRMVSLTVHPGVVWGVGHGFGVGGRAAFRHQFFAIWIHSPGQQKLADQDGERFFQDLLRRS